MRIALALSALALCVCYSLGSFAPSKVALSCGENVGKHVCLRVRQLLRSVAEVRDFEDVSALVKVRKWVRCIGLLSWRTFAECAGRRGEHAHSGGGKLVHCQWYH